MMWRVMSYVSYRFTCAVDAVGSVSYLWSRCLREPSGPPSAARPAMPALPLLLPSLPRIPWLFSSLDAACSSIWLYPTQSSFASLPFALSKVERRLLPLLLCVAIRSGMALSFPSVSRCSPWWPHDFVTSLATWPCYLVSWALLGSSICFRD